LGRRPTKVVAVALANKMARIAWAVLVKREAYRAPTRSSNALVPSGGLNRWHWIASYVEDVEESRG